LALVSAVLIPAGFAGLGLWLVPWVAFVPLLAAIDGTGPRHAAALGFVCGLPANVLGYHWLVGAIHRFGGFPLVVSWLLLIALCTYQALVFVLLAAGTARLQRAGVPMMMSAPLLMVAIETGFPFLFPYSFGATQYPVPVVLQVAELFGPAILTAVVLLFNVSAYGAIRRVVRRHKLVSWEVATGPIALILVVAYGVVRIAMIDLALADAVPVDVGVVQANLEMHQKWRDPVAGWRRHVVFSRQLERDGAQLIIWPEAAYTVRAIGEGEQNLQGEVSLGLHTPLLFGAVTHCREDEQRLLHNSAILLDAAGEVVGRYHKMKLFPFSEYLPGARWFPQLYNLVPQQESLRPGSRLDTLPFRHRGERYRIAALICYEDILPGFVRRLARASAPHLLVNLTNDAWFGDTAQPRIHLGLAVLRAVEQRRYLVRATNNGLSACVDPCGRVVASIGAFEQGTFVCQARLLEGRTLFLRWGNALGYLVVALVLVLLWRCRGEREKDRAD